ncbi:thioredoxin domain-containing protein 12-like [Babylonia areolata]|uniref:thioredoxin domain-containing protein 12-like n=1 Tax=Babylonia areolata TaxID=304850 RepID=UPI003FCF9B29
MIVLFHKQYCAPCVGLKPMLRGSEEVVVLSQRFIMVNCKEVDEENPIYRADRGAGGTFTPDGDYTPRIFFYDADGNRMDDIINEYGNRAFKYYYPPSEVALRALIRSMKTVLDITANGRRVKEHDKDEL